MAQMNTIAGFVGLDGQCSDAVIELLGDVVVLGRGEIVSTKGVAVVGSDVGDGRIGFGAEFSMSVANRCPLLDRCGR